MTAREDGTHVVLAIRAALKNLDFDRPLACDWHERIAVNSGALNAVFFHVTGKGKHPAVKSGAIDYLKVLEVAVLAAKKVRPDTSVVVLTNETTDIPIAGVQVVRLPADPEHMMYSRMRAYRAVARKLEGLILFLDTDVCLNRDFTPMFKGEFYIGLTYRLDDSFMPINEGLIMGRAGPGLNRFFDQALHTYNCLAELPEVKAAFPLDPRMWRGGQLTLAAMMDWWRPDEGILDVSTREVRYRVLPCEKYNYPVKGSEPAETLANKWALHFKGGEAKRKMGIV